MATWKKTELLDLERDFSVSFQIVYERKDQNDYDLYDAKDFKDALSEARRLFKTGDYDFVCVEATKIGYQNLPVWFNGEYEYKSDMEEA